MDISLAQPLTVVTTKKSSGSVQRVPVARKAVPARKPAAQNSSTTTAKPSEEPSSTTALTPSIACHDISKQNTPARTASPESQALMLPLPYNISAARSQSDQTLPAGWTTALDPDEKVFYINHLTGASSWTKPRWTEALLGQGWERRTAPDAKVYYFNVHTHATTWEHPSITRTPKEYFPAKTEVTVTSISIPEPPSTPLSSPNSDAQPLSPLSPSIEWETSQYGTQYPRRRSNFSLSSVSSTSSRAMAKLKLPPSASSNAVVKGTKTAAKLGLKGVKATGKAVKNNRKAIGLGLKVVNIVLKQTTGLDMGPLDSLLDVDVGFGGENGGCDTGVEDGGIEACSAGDEIENVDDDDGEQEEYEVLDDGTQGLALNEEEVVQDQISLQQSAVDGLGCQDFPSQETTNLQTTTEKSVEVLDSQETTLEQTPMEETITQDILVTESSINAQGVMSFTLVEENISVTEQIETMSIVAAPYPDLIDAGVLYAPFSTFPNDMFLPVQDTTNELGIESTEPFDFAPILVGPMMTELPA